MSENNSRIDLLEGMVEAVAHGRAGPGQPDVAAARARAGRGARARRRPAPRAGRAGPACCGWARPAATGRRPRAICLPSDPNGYVRLNLKGREAAGTLGREDVAPFVETLREGLMSFEDCEGGAAVAGVHDLFTEVKNGELDVRGRRAAGRAGRVGGAPGHARERRDLAPSRHDRAGGRAGRPDRPGRAGTWPTRGWWRCPASGGRVADGPRAPAGGRGRHGVRAAGRGCRWAAGAHR